MTAVKTTPKPPAKADPKHDAMHDKRSPAHAAAPHPAGDPAQDAVALLKADHAAVNQLFAEYEKTRPASGKQALVAELCTALSVHMQIEEEIFYPAITAVLKDPLLLAEAEVEHGGVKDLIAQLQDATPDGAPYDAKVKVLSEYVKHHVKEEHTEMFPLAKASTLDMAALGARLAARKDELMAQRARHPGGRA